MNVYLRELTTYRKSTIVWIASLSSLIIVFMALYPAFSRDITATKEVLAQLPPAIRDAFNISLENFFTLNGFFAYLLSFAILAAAIQAMNIGTGIISKEVAGKTADFLLTKPTTRTSVITAKLAAAFTILVITNVAFWTVAYVSASAAASDPFVKKTFFLLLSTMFLVQLIFMALGALFAVSIPKIKSVISVTLPTVFAFYIIGMIGDVLENDKFRFLSPFKYYDAAEVIDTVRLDGKYLAVELVLVVAAIAASYVIYIKKDVRAST